jgi:hypothetical protein
MASQVTVLKLSTLVRSIKDSQALQLDFVRILNQLEFKDVALWVEKFGDEILLKDLL